MERKEVCGNCRFFHTTWPDYVYEPDIPTTGECRAHTPNAAYQSQRWPSVTAAYDWCGEHRRFDDRSWNSSRWPRMTDAGTERTDE